MMLGNFNCHQQSAVFAGKSPENMYSALQNETGTLMTPKDPYPQGKATALMAYVLDMAGDNGADFELLDRIAEDICGDERERVRLISAASSSQNPEVPILLCDVLERRLARLRDTLEKETDRDEVIGVWSQRVAVTGMAASVGLAAAGVVSGGLGFLAVGGTVLAGGAATWGRMTMKRRGRIARRDVERTEQLIASIREARGA